MILSTHPSPLNQSREPQTTSQNIQAATSPPGVREFSFVGCTQPPTTECFQKASPTTKTRKYKFKRLSPHSINRKVQPTTKVRLLPCGGPQTSPSDVSASFTHSIKPDTVTLKSDKFTCADITESSARVRGFPFDCTRTKCSSVKWGSSFEHAHVKNSSSGKFESTVGSAHAKILSGEWGFTYGGTPVTTPAVTDVLTEDLAPGSSTILLATSNGKNSACRNNTVNEGVRETIEDLHESILSLCDDSDTSYSYRCNIKPECTFTDRIPTEAINPQARPFTFKEPNLKLAFPDTNILGNLDSQAYPASCVYSTTGNIDVPSTTLSQDYKPGPTCLTTDKETQGAIDYLVNNVVEIDRQRHSSLQLTDLLQEEIITSDMPVGVVSEQFDSVSHNVHYMEEIDDAIDEDALLGNDILTVACINAEGPCTTKSDITSLSENHNLKPTLVNMDNETKADIHYLSKDVVELDTEISSVDHERLVDAKSPMGLLKEDNIFISDIIPISIVSEKHLDSVINSASKQALDTERVSTDISASNTPIKSSATGLGRFKDAVTPGSVSKVAETIAIPVTEEYNDSDEIVVLDEYNIQCTSHHMHREEVDEVIDEDALLYEDVKDELINTDVSRKNEVCSPINWLKQENNGSNLSLKNIEDPNLLVIDTISPQKCSKDKQESTRNEKFIADIHPSLSKSKTNIIPKFDKEKYRKELKNIFNMFDTKTPKVDDSTSNILNNKETAEHEPLNRDRNTRNCVSRNEEVASSMLENKTSTEDDKKAIYKDDDSLEIEKITVNSDNEAFKEVLRKWKSTGIASHNMNLTYALHWRKKHKQHELLAGKTKTRGVLESLFVETKKRKREAVEDNPKNCSKRQKRVAVGIDWSSLDQNNRKQLEDFKRQHADRMQALGDELDKQEELLENGFARDKELMVIRHASEVEHLRFEEYLYSPTEGAHRAFRLRAEHIQEYHMEKDQYREKIDQLYGRFKSKKDKAIASYKEKEQSMFLAFRQQTENMDLFTMDCGNYEATRVKKAPISNKSAHNVIYMPKREADIMKKEDKLYDYFYSYTQSTI